MSESPAIAYGRTGFSVRAALGGGAAFSSFLLLLDLSKGSSSVPRMVCWLVLGLLVAAVLFPDQAEAGGGRLTVRGPFRTRRIRSDSLTCVRRGPGPSPVLVLRDTDGRSLEADVAMLVDYPLVWQSLELGIHHSQRTGTLRPGHHDTAAIAEIARAIDTELAAAVLDSIRSS